MDNSIFLTFRQDSDGFYSEFAGGPSGGGPMLAMRSNDNSRLPDYYTVAVVSRRSRHRAGTRYKRRGVDADGHVANFVESEQVRNDSRKSQPSVIVMYTVLIIAETIPLPSPISHFVEIGTGI